MSEQARVNSYTLLGALLAAPPQHDLLATIAALPPSGGIQDDCATALSTLITAAKTADKSAIAEDYHDLFIGLGRGKIVPYASWHITGNMMDKPLARLRNDLKNLGFGRQQKSGESEDHVAALCELMAMLSAENDTDSFTRQKKIFDTHVGNWIDSFFTDLYAQASTDFYRATSTFGQAFINFEKRYFSMS